MVNKMVENKKITVDELINKVPNKYELAIACGKIAREKLIEGMQKSEVMDVVFEEIMKDEIKIEEI